MSVLDELREHRLATTVLVVALVFALAFPALVAVTPSPAIPVGVDTTHGDSMGDYQRGLVVYTSLAEPDVGDAIVFDAGDEYVHHRIVEETSRGFVTQGDTRSAPDQAAAGPAEPYPHATESNIAGVVLWSMSLPALLRGLGLLASLGFLVGLVGFRRKIGAIFGRAQRRISLPSGRRVGTVAVIGMLVLSGVPLGVVESPVQSASASSTEFTIDIGATVHSMDGVESGGVVVAAGGNVSRYSSDGDVLWTATSPTPYPDNQIIARNGTVFMSAGVSGGVGAISLKNGSHLWNSSLSIDVMDMAASDDYLYAAIYNDGIVRFDKDTGKRTTVVPKSSFSGNPESVGYNNGSLYIGDGYDIRKKTVGGSFQWTYAGGGTQKYTEAGDGIILTKESGAGLVALNATDGSSLWSKSSSGISYSHEFDVLATTSGYLYANDGSVLSTINPGGDVATVPETENLVVYGSGDGTQLKKIRTDISHTYPVDGRVVNQEGQGVANATVRGLAVNKNKLSVSPSEVQEKAKSLIDQASSPLPDSWNPNRNLVGAGGLYKTAKQPYVATHTPSNWSLHGWQLYGGAPVVGANPKLGNPQLQVPAGERVVLSVWEPSATDSLTGGLTEDNVDSDLPGHTKSGTVIIEQIGPRGSVVDTMTKETQPLVELQDYTAPLGNIHEGVSVSLPRGVYRVHAKGSDITQTIVVGDPQAIATGWAQDLRSQAGSLTDYATDLREKLQNNTFRTFSTSTNATGHWSLDVGKKWTRVGVMAYKGPLGELQTDPRNLTMDDLREFYRSENYRGSLALSTETVQVQPPASGVTVEVRELDTTPFTDLSQYSNLTAEFREWLENTSAAELPRALQQRLDDAPKSVLVDVYRELAGLIRNTPMSQTARDYLEGPATLQNPEDASRAELITYINAYQYALSSQSSTQPVKDSTETITNKTASLSWLVPGEIGNLSQVSIIAHYANGTSHPVNNSYIELEDSTDIRVGGIDATRVRLVEYPLSNKTAMATFTLQAATNAGEVARDETRVKNPSFEGDIPTLRGIDFSTLFPGPSERVTLELQPSENARYQNLKSVTVWHNGTQVNATITDAETAHFTTTGAGKYTIYSTYTNHGGHEFEVVTSVQAGSINREMPASIRITSTPVGTVALSGDGLAGADVEMRLGGSETTITGFAARDGDIPSDIRVYSAGASLPPTVSWTGQLQYENGTAISEHVNYHVHLPALGANGLVYANGRPLPADSQVSYGVISQKSDQWVVTAVSDANGELTLKTHADPGLLTQLRFWLDTRIPDSGDLPFVGTINPPDTGLVARPAMSTPATA